MTNSLEPNDLSHLTDKEFHALCPQGEHAPGPEPLSLKAQAVLDAAIKAAFSPDAEAIAAAALRAAADQGENLYDPHEGKVAVVRVEQLLAIVSELEGGNG